MKINITFRATLAFIPKIKARKIRKSPNKILPPYHRATHHLDPIGYHEVMDPGLPYPPLGH